MSGNNTQLVRSAHFRGAAGRITLAESPVDEDLITLYNEGVECLEFNREDLPRLKEAIDLLS
jgi:hypothetical protein